MTVSRRQVLKAAGLGAAKVATSGSWSFVRAAAPRPTVAVFGGGVGGLTAAHELAERGFDVTVYEKRAWGGKVRSFGVPGTGVGGRRDLPAEHSPHGIFGNYQHMPDTMRRIPFGSNPNGVLDNLVATSSVGFARAGDGDDFSVPLGPHDSRLAAPNLQAFAAFLAHLPPQEAGYLLERLALFFSSSDARRFGQWEHMSWWDFAGAAHMSNDYRLLMVDFFTRALAAQPVRTTSARAVGGVIEIVVYLLLGQAYDLPFMQVFGAPKNEAFIEPWVALLRGLGVRLELGATLTGFERTGGRVTGAWIVDGGGTRLVTADYFVCALPMEHARPLWTPEMRDAAATLDRMDRLEARWANGMQFYLRERIGMPDGWVDYLDSPWALISVSQAACWPTRDLGAEYGDGSVRDCLSVAISDLDVPGVIYGKPVRELTPSEIARECWVQMQQHYGRRGDPALRDDLIASWYLDPGLHIDPVTGRVAGNSDPLFSNTVGSWENRPEAATAIPNLMLAADYVRAVIPVTTTEAANEAGRNAANAILAESGSRAAPVETWPSYRPPEWEALKKVDEQLFRAGLPHPLDVPQAARPVGMVTDIMETLERSTGLRLPAAR